MSNGRQHSKSPKRPTTKSVEWKDWLLSQNLDEVEPNPPLDRGEYDRTNIVSEEDMRERRLIAQQNNTRLRNRSERSATKHEIIRETVVKANAAIEEEMRKRLEEEQRAEEKRKEKIQRLAAKRLTDPEYGAKMAKIEAERIQANKEWHEFIDRKKGVTICGISKDKCIAFAGLGLAAALLAFKSLYGGGGSRKRKLSKRTKKNASRRRKGKRMTLRKY